jgi:hypothetical protein
MRVLFVTPSELSSGESITALHMAERIARRGGECRVLASAFTATLLESRLGGRVTRLTADRRANQALWNDALCELQPDAVIFADYPLLFFSNGVAPLASEGWVESLARLDALAITLDHLGYAQRVMRVSFGPPHLSMHSEDTPELPARMHVLLPCPMHEPTEIAGRRGAPFRYWDVPLGGPTGPRGGDRLLVLHATPNWAWRIAKRWALPHYAALGELLRHWFAGLPEPVTVVSVNNGELLAELDTPGLRIRNSGVVPPDEYERLLASADLLITDNAVSATIGRAACALLPVALLHNSRRLPEILDAGEPEARRIALAMERARLGAVFRYEAFPIWSAEDVDELGLFRDNSVTSAFARVELFGGEPTRRQLAALLTDAATRADLRERQRRYVERVSALPDAHDVVAALLAGRARGTGHPSADDTSCAH